MGLFQSTGLKRKIVAWLTTLVGFLWIVPGLPVGIKEAIDVLNTAIEALGGVAVTQAVVKGTLNKTVLGSIGSTTSALLLVAYLIPVLWPIIPVLTKINLIVNSLAAGQTLGKK